MNKDRLLILLDFGGDVFRIVELEDGKDFADTLLTLHWSGVESIKIIEVEELKDIQ